MALLRHLTAQLRRAAWALEPVLRTIWRAFATASGAIATRGRHLLNRLAFLPTHPRFFVASSVHRQWLIPPLCKGGMDEAAKPESGLGCLWALRKQVLPDSEGALCFNSLPHLKHLDDKAVLSILTRGFRRTTPLVTHVLYGQWDNKRLSELRERWSATDCSDPLHWIIKDAHSSNGFSAAIFDRSCRPLRKEDVAGGYCYVLQEYVVRPRLIDGYKFEMRQYMLVRGDGTAYTYERALIRRSSVRYAPESADRRAHITNKWVQTKWESANELCDLEEIELVSTKWPHYQHVLEASILPLMQDLADVIQPLLAAGASRRPASASANHFELFACDLVVDENLQAKLMEVNINPAFGAFLPATKAELIEPMFADLVNLVVLPAALGVAPKAGRFRRVRQAQAGELGGSASDSSSKEMQAHFAYITFKKSHRKRYEEKVVAERPVLLSGVGPSKNG